MKKASLFIIGFIGGAFLVFAQSASLETACETRGGIYNASAGTCYVTEASCETVGGGYDVISGVCYTAPEDKCERITKGVYDSLTGRCLSSSDLCQNTGGSFNQATNKCTPSNNGAQSGVYSPGVANGLGVSQSSGASFNQKPIKDFIALLQSVVQTLAPILVGLAMLSFFWFLVMFIWKGADNATERDKMKGGMLWSIVALFVMVSVWGIVGFIGNVTGIEIGGTMHGFKLPGAQ